MSRKKSSLLLGAVVGLLTSSCQPYTGAGGGIEVTMGASKVILVDAPQVSCRSAHSATPSSDLPPLSANLGRMAIAWQVPEGKETVVTLQLIYTAIRMRTSGLTGIDTPTIIAGQDLNCILFSNPDGGSTLTVGQGGIVNVNGTPTGTPYDFQFELRLGGFQPADTTKKSSFSGTGSVLVYGLLRIPGEQDTPIIGRGSFQFNFGGIVL